MSEFKIRAYGRMELAQLYSPQLTDIAAYRKMKKWISLCPGLLQRLYDLGYESKRRSFTPLEVRVIVDDLFVPRTKRRFMVYKAPLYDV
jgi:hypothetical protein